MEKPSGPARPHLTVFRDEYGDPQPPEISRKITACVLCRKTKVKCDVQHAGVPCTRCKKRGLSCTVKKSLQTLLEADASWKDGIEEEVASLTSRIDEEVGTLTSRVDELSRLLSSHQSIPPSNNTHSAKAIVSTDSPYQASSFQTHEADIVDDNEKSWKDDTAESSGPAAIPASVLSEVTGSPVSERILIRTAHTSDIITTGIITAEGTEFLFNYYMTKHDNYIYGVLEEGSTLASTRKSSPLLLAAICAVASLHVVSPDISHQSCYDECVRLCANHAFSSQNNLDDIRGLCIGAFWLADISWSLISTAVRISTELQLHRAYRGAIGGDKKAYVAARLYYLVYVCDHQFSIAYGRPPLTGQYEAVVNADHFLDSKFVVEDDYRLISQVKLWTTTSNIFATFGTDIQQPIDEDSVGDLQRFHLTLDSHRIYWATRFKHHKHIGNYPRKGVALHHHFAKLYLCSHAFRGTSDSNSNKSQMSLEMREIADTGVLSATSILRSINTDQEFQSFMSDLPLYFDTMIAFASVFLLRVSTSHAHVTQVEVPEILRLINQSVDVLEQITSQLRPAHPLGRIARGLRQLLSQIRETNHRVTQNVAVSQSECVDVDVMVSDAMDVPQDQFDWASDPVFDSFSMETYDFLSDHQLGSGFEMWGMDHNQR